MRSSLLPLGGMFVLACGLCLLSEQPAVLAGSNDAEQQVLNPKGEPKGFKAGDSARYAVWHKKGSWHVRTTTAKRFHQFTGKIYVEGGTFIGVEPHDLEYKGKFADWWRLHENRREIVIDFKTDRGIDGINFQCSKDATRIFFNLHIDGKHEKNLIFIGKGGQHPEMDPFGLPAHP